MKNTTVMAMPNFILLEILDKLPTKLFDNIFPKVNMASSINLHNWTRQKLKSNRIPKRTYQLKFFVDMFSLWGKITIWWSKYFWIDRHWCFKTYSPFKDFTRLYGVHVEMSLNVWLQPICRLLKHKILTGNMHFKRDK